MDFNDYSTSEPKFSWKPLVIIVGGIVIAIFLVMGAIWFWRGKDVRIATQRQTQEQIESERQIVQVGCAEGEDLATCSQRKQAVFASGNIKLCDGLKDEAYDGCVWEFADKANDATICEKVINEKNRLMCSQSVLLSLALSSRLLEDCDKMNDIIKRTECRGVLMGPITAENCLSRGKDAKECEIFTVAAEANEKQDFAVCATLTDERVLSCIELVRVDDPDFDGLSSMQETGTYGSDPYKADTDGDGYTDGQEVNAGFNPNGPGKLTKNK